jgi:AcrR family transcriptional regulator
MVAKETVKPDAGASAAGDAIESAHVPRKERERAIHRAAILEAARNLIARKAYSEITVQEIAADSEFSVGYIYKIFESKEDIYTSLVRKMGDELLALVDEAVSPPGGFEPRFRRLVHDVLVWSDENPAFTANYFQEMHMMLRTLPHLMSARQESQEVLEKKAAAFFREGIQAGVIEGDIGIMTKTLRALIGGFIGEDMLHGKETRKWTQYSPAIVRVFMRAFAPEGGPR